MLNASDNICTALQLTNFWQDLSIDIQKNRLYIPLEDISRFGYSEELLLKGEENQNFKKLMEFEVERTEEFFTEGRRLLKYVGSDLTFELHLTWNGGMEILKKIKKQNYEVFSNRPVIKKREKILILLKSFLRMN
jgi:phytoene/squalene synthetase